MFKVEIEDKVKKKIDLIKDKNLSKRIWKSFKKLEQEPMPKNPKHYLTSSKNKSLCEIAIDQLRFYYVVVRQEVKVFEVVYEGKVNIFELSKSHKSGSFGKWNRQQKYINKILKWFKKNLK